MTFRKFSTFLISFIFIFISLRFYSFVEDYSSWQYADWLINYQGGFVRRGLFGEIFFNIYKLFSLRLDLIVFLFVIFLYLVFSYYLIRSLKYLEISKLNVLIILSPGFFLYPMMNSEVIGRKDILLITTISYLIFLFDKIKINYQLPVILISIVTLSLTHTGFLFYAPYLICLYFLSKTSKNLKITNLDIVSIISTVIFLYILIYNYSGSQAHVLEICKSIKNFISDECGKADMIAWIAKDTSEYIGTKTLSGYSFFLKNLLIYSISFLLVYMFIFIRLFYSTFNTSRNYINKLNPLFLFLALFVLTCPIYLIGIDWGRYIYLSYSCTFFLFIFSMKNNLIQFKKIQIPLLDISKTSFVIIIFFYSFFWTFPFYNATSFKLVLKKPVISILKKINN